MACNYYIQGGKKYFIPDCWGSAAFGKDQCTCLPNSVGVNKRIDLLNNQITELKKEIAQLKK